MEIIQNTTSDPAQVLEKLSAANFHETFSLGQRGSSQLDVSNYERNLQEARAACDAHETTCPGLMMPLPGRARQLAQQERLDVAQILAELHSVVEQMAQGNGRRTMILISDGFPLRAGQTSFTLLDAYFPQFRSSLGVESMQDMAQPVFKLAVKANVPIYTIDSRGLYTSPGLDASRGVNSSVALQVNRALDGIAIDSGQTLSEIAAATGGTFFQNSNDLLAGLKRAFADGREYYMLAYVSSNGALDSKFRKIEVKVRDNKAVVGAKRGYWAASQ